VQDRLVQQVQLEVLALLEVQAQQARAQQVQLVSLEILV
jgi:hypothetical protein